MLVVGDIIDVVHHSDARHTYKVSKINVKGDGRGQTELETLSEELKGHDKKKFNHGERMIVVDALWFNSKLTGRKITKINDHKRNKEEVQPQR
jgi:hypothetical protein